MAIGDRERVPYREEPTRTAAEGLSTVCRSCSPNGISMGISGLGLGEVAYGGFSADHAVVSNASDDPWMPPPQVETAAGTANNSLVWRLQLGAGAVCLVAALLGVLAHYLHPRIAPWSSTFEAPVMGISLLTLGAREALRAGAVTRNGWWLSRRTQFVLATVGILAALAVVPLGVGQFTGAI
jgi:hypothetical protein